MDCVLLTFCYNCMDTRKPATLPATVYLVSKTSRFALSEHWKRCTTEFVESLLKRRGTAPLFVGDPSIVSGI